MKYLFIALIIASCYAGSHDATVQPPQDSAAYFVSMQRYYNMAAIDLIDSVSPAKLDLRDRYTDSARMFSRKYNEYKKRKVKN